MEVNCDREQIQFHFSDEALRSLQLKVCSCFDLPLPLLLTKLKSTQL